MSGLFEGYQIVSPPFDEGDGRRLAEELFGRRGDAAELGSHQDRNFLITGVDGGRSVLKIANPHFGHDSLEMQNAAMHHVAAAGLPFATPLPIPSLRGSEIVPVERDGETYDVRMTSWVDGEPMTEARHLDGKARSDLGAIAAEAALALHGFDHPAADRVLQWDLKHARAVVDGLISHVGDPARRELVERSMQVHDRALERLAADLRVQVIHGDVTDFNVVGRRDGDGRLMPCGLIDFGDMTRSYLVAEAAVAAASLTWHDPDDALAVIVDVVSGFHARLPLTEPELAAVFPLVLGRAAGGAVSTWQQAMAEPGNRYANDLIEIDWGSLAAVAAVDADLAEAACRAACGMDPHPASAALGHHLAALALVPPIDSRGRVLRLVDLTVASPEYAHGEWETAAGVAAAAAVDAGELAVGRYGEARLHRSGRPAAVEPATVHLGVDLFADAGEPVRCPLDARVVSSGDDRVTLESDLPGHGSYRIVLEGITPAEPLTAGAGELLGTVAEAPGRPLPHLHIQLALCDADPPPGWARPSQREAWMGICPDPSALAGIDAAAPAPARDAVFDMRAGAVASAQLLYYRHPPRMVRGWRHRLYDEDGRPYLDMVNNVAVLGHSHPAVAAAAQRALRLLNTNSRFLYDGMARFAARLAELLPDPLDRVFLVSTGSEANDLALRLARTYTGRHDVIAVAGAYHGWTTATYDVGTSLFDNPAAALEPPPGLRVVPQANTYRGAYGLDDPRGRRPLRRAGARCRRGGGRVHLRAGAGQRGRRAGPARLPRARLPVRPRRRRRLHRR